MRLTASEAVAHVRKSLRGRPGFLVGSAVAADVYGKHDAYTDVDVFVPSTNALASTVQFMLDHGCVMNEQELRKWNRWQTIGPGDWHTSSIRLETLAGVEVNVVYKTVGKAPLTSLHAVLGSFDFGYVAMGYDLKTGTFHDGRTFWFGEQCDMHRLGLLPDRHLQWETGSIGRYTGVRQAQRWAKFALRGYDMSLSSPVLVQGYRTTATYYLSKDDPEYREYAPLYLALADLIEVGGAQEIEDAFKGLQPHDTVNSLMGGLP